MPTGSVGRSKSRCGMMKISPEDPMALCIDREINQLLHLFNNSSTVKDIYLSCQQFSSSENTKTVMNKNETYINKRFQINYFSWSIH
jgi:hypothetical protein